MSNVIAFTDGASANNQDASKRMGGWGIVMMLVNEQNERDQRPNAYKELSGTLAGATNNQAELEAVRQVLLAFKRDGVNVTIVTDSEYVIGVLSRHWKAARNKELIAEIKALMSKHSVRFEKVAGHAGVEFNERADALAVAATQANA
jgi:ribonuclease HI